MPDLLSIEDVTAGYRDTVVLEHVSLAIGADEAWALNKCRETPAKAASPTPPPPPVADRSGRPPLRSGSSVY